MTTQLTYEANSNNSFNLRLGIYMEGPGGMKVCTHQQLPPLGCVTSCSLLTSLCPLVCNSQTQEAFKIPNTLMVSRTAGPWMAGEGNRELLTVQTQQMTDSCKTPVIIQ